MHAVTGLSCMLRLKQRTVCLLHAAISPQPARATLGCGVVELHEACLSCMSHFAAVLDHACDRCADLRFVVSFSLCNIPFLRPNVAADETRVPVCSATPPPNPSQYRAP